MKLRFGDIVLIEVPFVDSQEFKLRPALVLFEEFSNIVVAGITSNLRMDGILIEKKEGLIMDSVLKLNYIFTIPKIRVRKKLTHLSEKKYAKPSFQGLASAKKLLKAVKRGALAPQPININSLFKNLSCVYGLNGAVVVNAHNLSKLLKLLL